MLCLFLLFQTTCQYYSMHSLYCRDIRHQICNHVTISITTSIFKFHQMLKHYTCLAGILNVLVTKYEVSCMWFLTNKTSMLIGHLFIYVTFCNILSTKRRYSVCKFLYKKLFFTLVHLCSYYES